KKAQYTIAVVDEGLLDLTRFRTPNPWKFFFQKMRLGIRTFDIFSQVISANVGDVFKTFSIGGDMDYRKSQQEPGNKKKRFKPVSLFEGPLETDDNGYAKVRFDMPNYIGSVRIMVIAANHKSYASAEKTVPVKKELMVLPTLPRVIGPDEEFVVPTTVFAMKDNLGDVSVKIETEGPINTVGNDQVKLHFDKTGDEDCSFKLKTQKAAGASKVKLSVSNGAYSASYTVDLNVRPTSPRVYNSSVDEMVKDKSYTFEVPTTGIDGTNRASITMAGYPGMNFKHRLYWLIHYPYGCVEQTTSSVFPQLYMKKFMDFTDSEKQEIDDNLNAGIARLSHFQLYSGGLSYWPGNSNVSAWGTVYAAHFLIEAKNLGYYVPDPLYNGVIKYMKNTIRSISNKKIKVYYAYALALSGNAVTSEINVLAESYLNELSNPSRWMLAASCHLAGMDKVANKIVSQSKTHVDDYIEFSGTYGSTLRDKAMILDAMITLEKMDKAFNLMKELTMAMDNHRWYSTQTVSYVLLANGRYISKIVEKDSDPLVQGTIYLPDGNSKDFSTNSGKEINLSAYVGQKVRVQLSEKTTFNKVFAIMNSNGVPLQSTQKDTSSHLLLQVKYYTETGAELDPTTLKQGNSFWIHLHAENKTDEKIDELALMYMLPSGWEFQNTRLQSEVTPPFLKNLKLNKEEYVDIRDDRMMWFFDMKHKDVRYDYYKYDFIAKVNVVTIGNF
ncbi:MAG TPA: alpha-2-macroglobulin family protein, partial [Prolixibacteraceae bacterium]|nr:alpha-2-macroglobulin family protein [Prolixibacteraceae bacterium]